MGPWCCPAASCSVIFICLPLQLSCSPFDLKHLKWKQDERLRAGEAWLCYSANGRDGDDKRNILLWETLEVDADVTERRRICFLDIMLKDICEIEAHENYMKGKGVENYGNAVAYQD